MERKIDFGGLNAEGFMWGSGANTLTLHMQR